MNQLHLPGIPADAPRWNEVPRYRRGNRSGHESSIPTTRSAVNSIGALDKRTYHDAPPEIRLYPHLVEIQRPKIDRPDRPHRHGKRGCVTSYTDPSRLRLLRLLAKVRLNSLAPGLFLTLTYHWAWTRSGFRVQTDKDALFAAFRRRWPSINYMWRLEPQQRGAPHLHLMMWLPLGQTDLQQPDHRRWIAQTWHRIADPTSRAHAHRGAHFEDITSYRKASSYVSKYLAKEVTGRPDVIEGRRWGTSRGLPIAPTAAVTLSYPHYLRLRKIAYRLLRAKTGREDWARDYTDKAPTVSLFIDREPFQRWLLDHGYTLEDLHDADAINPAPS